MRKPMNWQGLFGLAAGLLLIPSLLFGQTAIQGTGLGEITEINHDAGYMYINDQEFTFVRTELRVTIRGQNARLVHLQRGIFVRYEADSQGNLTKVELVGPPQRISEILNQ